MAGLNVPRHGRGFTLIEIAVVLLVISIMMGAIGIELHATDRVTVRDQAKRMALLVHALRQQAILQGQPFGLRFGRRGYRFLGLSPKGHWKPVSRDSLFRPRHFPAGLTVSASVGGSGRASLVQVSPGGVLTPFTAVFREGDSDWRVVGSANGDVSAKPTR
ncbi:MAG: GspH/FimT family pseudopilin [Acidiferrobacteraceae bacterium]